jgi:hypothetical protein
MTSKIRIINGSFLKKKYRRYRGDFFYWLWFFLVKHPHSKSDFACHLVEDGITVLLLLINTTDRIVFAPRRKPVRWTRILSASLGETR